MRRLTLRTGALFMLLAVVVGCSKADPPVVQVNDPLFNGLDPALVQEVLDNPVAQERVEGDDTAAARARYQGMVRNFSACRGALQVYRGWLTTGAAPPFPAQAEPANPSSTATVVTEDVKRVESLAASGDISLLRTELTRDSGCGVWVPARAGDVSGPTIADVVNGKV